MQVVGQSGEILSTVNKRLAVILLTFGGKLCEEGPIGWDDVHRSVDAFIDGEPPRRVISFNFQATKWLKDLAAAYESPDKSKFPALLQTIAGKDNRDRVLLALQVFTETIGAGLFLVELLSAMPESAKWDVVPNSNGTGMVKMGKCASDELRAEFLNKV